MDTNQFSHAVFQLEEARDNRDADGVEDGLMPFFNSELGPVVPLLCELVLLEFHTRHEDIIGLLQKAADARAIPSLRQAVLLKPRLEYLDYDDYGSYYKKCFWALKAIGTPESIAVIREFTASEDPVIREQAAYRYSKCG
ncbi:MAG: hypothetical protein EOP88_15190 [Verrucomicrobiaceae bacterium]|nr:MAG: hypothetical protein EOP88_15190 [Verrucomicrobiaceae bacterium]